MTARRAIFLILGCLLAVAVGCRSKSERIVRNKVNRATRQLQSGSEQEAMQAARKIANHRELHEVGVAPLSDALARPEYKVRATAAFSLGQIGSAAATATEKLRKGKTDENIDVRIACEYALAQIRQGGSPDLTVLVAALGHEREEIRGRSAMLLGFVGPRAQQTVPELQKLAAKGGRDGEAAQAAIWMIEGKRPPVPEPGSSPGPITQ